MSGFMKRAKELISKGDDIKMKKKFSPFFVLLPVYLPLIAVLSLFLLLLHGLEANFYYYKAIIKCYKQTAYMPVH